MTKAVRGTWSSCAFTCSFTANTSGETLFTATHIMLVFQSSLLWIDLNQFLCWCITCICCSFVGWLKTWGPFLLILLIIAVVCIAVFVRWTKRHCKCNVHTVKMLIMSLLLLVLSVKLCFCCQFNAADSWCTDLFLCGHI